MVKKETALLIRERSIAARRELTSILSEVKEQCSDEDFEMIKRAVGLSIGRIQTEVLEPLYRSILTSMTSGRLV